MKNIVCIALLLLTLTSCTKIIDIDLNTTDPKVIIEGSVTDEKGGFQVKISKTVNFSDANNYPPVKGAVVTITDNTGKTYTLPETKAGFYSLKDTIGVSGRTYSLKIVAEGKTYTSSSTMPKAVALLGAEIEKSPFNNGPRDTVKFYDYYPIFLDPANEKNNYRFILSNNGIKDKGFNNVINDNLFNGSYNPVPLFADTDFKVKTNDVITIEMHCIDKAVYEYFFSLAQVSGGRGDSGTPANPVNNIVGGALGYFSAHTVRRVTAVVP
jgi:hypothetical protein